MAEKGGYWTGEVGVQAWGKVPSNPLSSGSWQDYYTWRGLSLDSPMAVLLTYPLTVYTTSSPIWCPSPVRRAEAGGGVRGAGGPGGGGRGQEGGEEETVFL